MQMLEILYYPTYLPITGFTLSYTPMYSILQRYLIGHNLVVHNTFILYYTYILAEYQI